jgi:DNA-directed RNA polymerase delta subunit
MADQLEPAIAALQQKLTEQLRMVTDTKRTINMLLKMSGKDPLYTEDDAESSGSVRPDQFYGKGLATSAAEYLTMRKQACQADEILRALAAGGFDFDLLEWKENDRLRMLALSLAKNTGAQGKFHRLKNGSFGLRNWYDEDFLKKAALGAEAAGKAKKKKASAKKEAAKTPVAANKGKATEKPHIVPDAKTSAKEKNRPEADETAQKGAAAS